MKRKLLRILPVAIVIFAAVTFFLAQTVILDHNDQKTNNHASKMVDQGRETFRFNTFGDQAFWGDTLLLHQAIEGAKLDGVGPGVSPATALAVGLKVDIDALPSTLVEKIKAGQVNLNDPATTLALLKLNSVIGVTGKFNSAGTLESIGIQCALCHSTVDNSQPSLCFNQVTPNPGTGCIGHRLDGWANRDLNVGAIVALAPNLQPFADLLGVDQATVRNVLNSWGPGKFDAELALDGKAFNPQQVTDGTTTGTNVSGASLIPPAFGLAGVNLHTWIGWGSVTHWNAFVANLEMHGKGTFYDPRLNNSSQFPIAAKAGFADVRNTPDLISPKLPALHFYQLAIPAPAPPKGSFSQAAAEEGKKLFEGKAQCSTCHVSPTMTEPGWNMHTAADVCIDDFEASRGPDDRYRTSPLNGLWTHSKGGFYHDGRFPTLDAVVAHYNTCKNLGLTAEEQSQLVQYLLSLPGQ